MLLGHLASRFSTPRENLATEAVAFIVNHSAAMRDALRGLVLRTGIEVPQLVRFRAQAGDEQGNIPDLIGVDAVGVERLFIENKFWAGLTENQPAGYLDRLPAEGGAVLLFVVPSRRLPIIWTELASSATSRGGRLPNPERTAGDLLFLRLTPSTALATTTWNVVLDSLEAAARASGEASAGADIAQLRNLCEVVDSEAFVPVCTEELTNLDVPRRLIGLADLVPDLTEKAVEQRIADRTGVTQAHGWYTAGRYLKIGPAGAWLGIDYKNWSRYGITPLWVKFSNTAWGRAPLVMEALKSWTAPKLFEEGGLPVVPLTILPGAPRERVLEDLLEQLSRLHDALHLVPVATTASSR